MPKTIVNELADFTTGSDIAEQPADVMEESKRILLDSIGCAPAGTEHLKGKVGIEYGRLRGGGCKVGDIATLMWRLGQPESRARRSMLAPEAIAQGNS